MHWYRTPLEKEKLKSLHSRDNLKGGLQTIGYLLIIILTGILSILSIEILSWPWWIITILIHGTIIKFTINAVHELGHGTVFKSAPTNSIFCKLFAFIGWHNHYAFWASHLKHHKYTLHFPNDQEVVLRPPHHFTLKEFFKSGFLNLFSIYEIIILHLYISRSLFKNEWTHITVTALNETEKKKVTHWSRLLLMGHLCLSLVFFLSGYWYLIIIISLTPAYGNWLFYLINNTQHTGLIDNTNDFRLCCRTIELNPVFRFLYWQMNYHTAHHMYPGVSCYKLAGLHKAIEHDLPVSTSGIYETWKQIFSIQNQQLIEPEYQFVQILPKSINTF